mmetsp:Transcript_14583/g.32734  ORF Transcript_14583/g.32734 Transcript_14583/m.32734 type:complete len:219 (-) Transcript_14583:313-969(-)
MCRKETWVLRDRLLERVLVPLQRLLLLLLPLLEALVKVLSITNCRLFRRLQQILIRIVLLQLQNHARAAAKMLRVALSVRLDPVFAIVRQRHLAVERIDLIGERLRLLHHGLHLVNELLVLLWEAHALDAKAKELFDGAKDASSRRHDGGKLNIDVLALERLEHVHLAILVDFLQRLGDQNQCLLEVFRRFARLCEVPRARQQVENDNVELSDLIQSF